MTERILVIGCGNLLAADDGVGLHVVSSLKKYTLPPEVQIIEAGCPGLKLLELWENAGRVIIIDAVKSGAKPGTIHVFNSKQLIPREIMPLSSHSINVIDAVELGKKLGILPELLLIIGIEIETEEPYLEKLSLNVAQAVPKACQHVLEEINKIIINK